MIAFEAVVLSSSRFVAKISLRHVVRRKLPINGRHCRRYYFLPYLLRQIRVNVAPAVADQADSARSPQVQCSSLRLRLHGQNFAGSLRSSDAPESARWLLKRCSAVFKPSAKVVPSVVVTGSAASVVNVHLLARVTASSTTLSISGVTICTPGYNVPGRAPDLTECARPRNRQAPPRYSALAAAATAATASCRANCQRTGRKGRLSTSSKKLVAVTAPVSPAAATLRRSFSSQQSPQLRRYIYIVDHQRGCTAE